MATISAQRLLDLLDYAERYSPAAPPGTARYRILAEHLRTLVVDGKLNPGDRLPSERDLTRALGASRTTITTAYRDLRDTGYVVSRQGSGSVVTLPGASAGVARRSLMPPTRDADHIDLTCATLPAAPGIATAFQQALEDLPHWLSHGGYEAAGLPVLREAIAASYEDRGVPTSADQIVVTTGAVSALTVVLRALSSTGDRALMENPSYPNAVDAVAHSGLRLVGLPMDPVGDFEMQERAGLVGWDIGLLSAITRQSAPRFAVLIPDFHNPTGTLITDPIRAEAAQVLRASHTQVIIDETLADLDLGDNPETTPFCAFDPAAVTLGSLSKSFWGGLRVGWIRAPRVMVSALLEARATLDLSTPILEQLAAVHLIARRQEVLPPRMAGLADQRDVLVAQLRQAFPDWGVPSPEGGLALWCRLPQPNAGRVVQSAERHGLLLAHGARFGLDGGFERYLRLPFTEDAPTLTEAVERLHKAYHATNPDAAFETQRRGPLIA